MVLPSERRVLIPMFVVVIDDMLRSTDIRFLRLFKIRKKVGLLLVQRHQLRIRLDRNFVGATGKAFFTGEGLIHRFSVEIQRVAVSGEGKLTVLVLKLNITVHLIFTVLNATLMELDVRLIHTN
jgi:hypothetical protein